MYKLQHVCMCIQTQVYITFVYLLYIYRKHSPINSVEILDFLGEIASYTDTRIKNVAII